MGWEGTTEQIETNLSSAGSQPLAVWKVRGVEWMELSLEVGELSVGTTPCRICSQSWTSFFNLEAGAREARARLGVKDGGPWRGGTNGDFQAHPGDSYTPPVVRKVEIFIIISGGS